MRVDVDIISAYPIMNIYMDKNMWSVFHNQDPSRPYFWIERSDGGFPTSFASITDMLAQLEIECEKNNWDMVDIDIFQYLHKCPIPVKEIEEVINRFVEK